MTDTFYLYLDLYLEAPLHPHEFRPHQWIEEKLDLLKSENTVRMKRFQTNAAQPVIGNGDAGQRVVRVWQLPLIHADGCPTQCDG